MSKKMLSTLLLFLLCAGFGIFGVVTIINATDSETRFWGYAYLLPSVASLIALIMLPFKSDEAATETKAGESKESETRA